MKNILEYSLNSKKNRPDFFLTDIDDTMTTHGQLHPDAYNALWKLKNAGVKVIPITGRPAGWCEMIARLWPVDAIVGENGAFYFSYKNQTMHRWFSQDEKTRISNQLKLKSIEAEILNQFPQLKISSDQFCRLTDLAVDFNEDIKGVPSDIVKKIVEIFQQHGATAKISSIHVNGWFGSHNKVSTALHLLENDYKIAKEDIKSRCAFSGDSPNDEPMFEVFPLSFGVANINRFTNQMKHLPTYVTNKEYGDGFCEIVDTILK